MWRKPILLISFILVSALVSSVYGAIEYKVDLCLNLAPDGEPPVVDEATFKGSEPGYEDWIAWPAWNKSTREGSRKIEDIGGSGIHAWLTLENTGHNVFKCDTTGGKEPICNSWLQGPKYGDGYDGPPWENIDLVLYGEGLTAGEYLVYAYHNDPLEFHPEMPLVEVETYCVQLGQIDAPLDPDCTGVVQIAVGEPCDVNVAIQQEIIDANLVPSLVKFTTDGSPVQITYWCHDDPCDNTSVFNAFILVVAEPPLTASDNHPRSGASEVCPDANLSWRAGADANLHNVYFGSDLPDEIVIFEDDFESGIEPNWTSVGWVHYDANEDPNKHSGRYSVAAMVGGGEKTLTSKDINTVPNEMGAFEVDFWVRKNAQPIAPGELKLYYYNGTAYNFIEDLNSLGPDVNNVWLHYTGQVADSQYLISNFKVQLKANVGSGDAIYVDDVTVTNTWPLHAKWFMGTQTETFYDPCGLLDFNETYYWRIDEVNGPNIWQGRYWSFTTEEGKGGVLGPGDGAWSVDVDADLSWEAACLATAFDVYFGTDYNDVNSATDPNAEPGQGRQPGTDFDPGTLESFTRYYWRVDQITQSGLVKGNVWTFKTIGGALFHYTFDGVLDANVHDPFDANVLTDSTGNVMFQIRGDRASLTYDQPNPLWNTTGTSAKFDDDVGLYRGTGMLYGYPSVSGSDITDLAGTAYTIEMWLRPDDLPDDEDETVALFSKWDRSYAVDVNDAHIVRFQHSGTTIEAPDTEALEEGLWYHIAAVFDSTDSLEPQKLYVDGLQVAGGGTTALNPPDDDDHATIGFRVTPARAHPKGAEPAGDELEGMIDELRVSDLALEMKDFLFRADFNVAWHPSPRDREKDVLRDTDLTWTPGDNASSHKVFFGKTWEDVNSMTDPCDVNTLGNEHYNPGSLLLDTTYYWRVDEVNGPCTWPGPIWRFTTADYFVVDDMESYDTSSDLYNTWVDRRRQPLWTGSTLLLGERPVYAVHGGTKTMRYSYDTSGTWADLAYAEAWLPLEDKDWTSNDVKILVLFFYGKPINDANDTEQMYVGIEDTNGTYAEIRYGDYREGEEMRYIKVEDWHRWLIALADFNDPYYAEVPNDVDLTDVNRFYIGFGNRRTQVPGGGGLTHEVKFDDIRLSLPLCVPEFLKPVADLDNDCNVTFGDIDVLLNQWLRSDVNFIDLGIPPQQPKDANLIGHWALDGDANDSSVHGNHGTIEGYSYQWVAGYDGVSPALRLTGDKTRVLAPDAPILNPKHQVSASAWVKVEKENSGSARVVVKGSNDNETFSLDCGDDDFGFMVRDANGEGYGEGNDIPALYEWFHLAGTYDGNMVKCYLNGQLVGEEDANFVLVKGWDLMEDSNSLAIGNLAEDLEEGERQFRGAIDDVRVYDYALSHAEVAWLAGDGSDFIPLESEANLYIGLDPQRVNFRDYAAIFDYWLEEKKWPAAD